MPKLTWDDTGKRLYETGTDRGVLFNTDNAGAYTDGVAWNGLSKVTESPDGAEETAIYADNGKYLSLLSTENFKGTIEAYTYPDEFGACDGSAELATGVTVSQQTRAPFGLVYRTLVGNDVKATDYGYKIHLVWGAKASPAERAYETVNDTPAAITFSWAFTTTPVQVEGLKPTASMVIDSTAADATALKKLEDMIYGTESNPAKLPSPAEVKALFANTPAA